MTTTTHTVPGSISDVTRAATKNLLNAYRDNDENKTFIVKSVTENLQDGYAFANASQQKDIMHGARLFLRIISLYKLK